MGEMNRAQKKWCKEYEESTFFEPIMDDFRNGNETFLEAARRNIKWFEDWSCDALRAISHKIPGYDDD